MNGPEATSTASVKRRSLLSRVSFGHVVVVLVGLMAGLLNLSVIRSQDQMVSVATAAFDIQPGAPVAEGAVEWVSVPTAGALNGLITGGIPDGFVSLSMIRAGDPLRLSDLASVAGDHGRRSLSIPVGREHAVGGALIAGDRVDVIEASDDGASFVATGLEVLTVPQGSSGALPTAGTYYVVVSVTADEALRLSLASQVSTLTLVRSTGAEPVRSMEVRR